MITEKYPYLKLSRDTIDGLRKYKTPDGSRLPSVTTILDKTKSQDTIDGLAVWRSWVGHDNAAKITTEAANVGTAMHNILENWSKGITHNPGNNMLQRTAKRMAAVIVSNIDSNIDELWGSEINLYYPQLYAGTTDLVGIYNGKPAIMDFKQSNKLKKDEWVVDYKLQLSAYIMAHNAMFDTNITNGHIFVCTRACQFQHFKVDETDISYWTTLWANRVSQYYDQH